VFYLFLSYKHHDVTKINEPSRILRFAQTVGQGVGGSSKHATADVGLMNFGGKKIMFQANLRKHVLSP
jgi:hypothetical protein